MCILNPLGSADAPRLQPSPGKDSCNALGPEAPPLVPPLPRGMLQGAAGGAQGPREEAGWGARPGAFRG